MVSASKVSRLTPLTTQPLGPEDCDFESNFGIKRCRYIRSLPLRENTILNQEGSTEIALSDTAY
jgi:hypothetical protein